MGSDMVIRVGRGRSAVVYRDGDTARKVFEPDPASRLVMIVLTGAPNPYGWNADAVQAADARRRILSRLAEGWFGEAVRVLPSRGWGWNEHARTFELEMDYVDGRHAPLRYAAPDGREPVDTLLRDVMKPLQKRLRDAGFDGLVWQAGFGNPVAVGNFMEERGPDGRPRWAWIDLESGVPALFPLNPLTLLFYYVPRSLALGRPLFDDVDVPVLRRYLAATDTPNGLLEEVDRLERHQDAWKSLTPMQCGIGYRLARGALTETQAAWYARYPAAWYLFCVHDALARAPRLAADGARWVATRPWRRWGRDALRFVGSSGYRRFWAFRWVSQRIGHWRRRRFLDREQARRLRADLRRQGSGEHLTDFAMHLALKPVAKIQWVIMPLIYLAGVLESKLLGVFFIVAAGSIVRTAYTSMRVAQAVATGRRPPWLALGIGVFPVVGNAAFPVQLAYEGRSGGVARFIVYDMAARVGRLVPIWGGRDSLLEHRALRLADLLLRGVK